MKEPRGLRTAIQAIGVYFLCQCAYSGMGAIARLILGRYVYPHEFPNPSSPDSALFYTVIEHLVVAAEYLILAWVLLVKTEWSVKTVVGFSKPRAAESETNDEA